jgi:hypothetical protein
VNPPRSSPVSAQPNPAAETVARGGSYEATASPGDDTVTADPDPVAIRRADPADAEALAGLAARLFRQTYGAFNQPEHIDTYLADNFTPRRIVREITSSSVRVLLADGAGVLCGYAFLRNGPAPAPVGGGAPVELARGSGAGLSNAGIGQIEIHGGKACFARGKLRSTEISAEEVRGTSLLRPCDPGIQPLQVRGTARARQ